MNLKELKELAEKATPGPWYVEDNEVRSDLSPETTDRGVAECSIKVCIVDRFSNESDPFILDRAYIAAANPQTILALLADREQLRVALQYLVHGEPKDGDKEKACTWAAQVTHQRVTVITTTREIFAQYLRHEPLWSCRIN